MLALADGFRESEASWKEVLLSLRQRGLQIDPKLALGDGALGFWNALPQVLGATREQRCWLHKTAKVLKQLPKHLQAKAKSDLHQSWRAATREQAHAALTTFVQSDEPKYPKAAECLAQDQIAWLACYDFSAAHWMPLRTTHPIESTFVTVRLRTAKTRGCGSRTSILSMVFQLVNSGEERWRALRGSELIAKVITGVQFKNGVEVPNQSRQKVAA